jgi:hypothetical protein
MKKRTALEILQDAEAKHPLREGAVVDHVKRALCPPDRQDAMTEKLLGEDFRYAGAKRLDDDTYVVVQKLYSTAAIGFVDSIGVINKRYCFSNLLDCLSAWDDLKTCNDEPEGWIARRPERPEDKEREFQRTLAAFRAREAAKDSGSSFEP